MYYYSNNCNSEQSKRWDQTGQSLCGTDPWMNDCVPCTTNTIMLLVGLLLDLGLIFLNLKNWWSAYLRVWAYCQSNTARTITFYCVLYFFKKDDAKKAEKIN